MPRYYIDIDGRVFDEFDDEVYFRDGRPLRMSDLQWGSPRRRSRRPSSPPPPPKPTAEQTKDNFSSWVRFSRHFSGIRLQSITDVTKAITLFANGSASALAETTNQIGDAHGGMAAGMFMMAGLSARSDGFLDKVLTQVSAKLEAGHAYHGSWDYDGPGPFHKAGINIDVLEDDAYRLGIYAAYVGSRPEHQLGNRLVGLHESGELSLSAPPQIGMSKAETEMRFAVPEGSDRFEIPIRAVLADIDDQLAHLDLRGRGKRLTHNAIIGMLIPDEPYDMSGKTLVVYEDDTIKVIVQIPAYRVEPNYALREQPDRDAEIRLDDAGILSGPARRHSTFRLYESVALEVAVVAADRPLSFVDEVKDRIDTVAMAVHQSLIRYGGEY